MDIPHNIASVMTTHEKLLKDVISTRTANTSQKRSLIADAEDLITAIEACSKQATSSEEYTLLSSAAVQWQSVFSSILGMPRNIDLAPPPQPVQLPVEKVIADDRQITQWINDIAHYNSIIRRAQTLLREVGDILQRAEETATENEATIAEDWHRATVYFASEVIDGRIHLINQLTADTYYRLESVWLKDVKELKAYFIWRNRKATAEDNYYLACEQIRDRLVSCAKGSSADFQEARRYIEGRYLTDGEIRTHENEMARQLVSIKAHRVWETTGGIYNDDDNWRSAETYTRMFYDNIIPAVTKKNTEKAASVLRAFGFSKAPENRYLIINAFEAAIAIYFLDAGVIRDLLNDKVVTWNMVL